jgi:hypothetical protein
VFKKSCWARETFGWPRCLGESMRNVDFNIYRVICTLFSDNEAAVPS